MYVGGVPAVVVCIAGVAGALFFSPSPWASVACLWLGFMGGCLVD